MPSIATRILTLSTGSGDQPVRIAIAAPQSDGKGWTCNFTIGWPEGTQTGYGAGVDGVQALSIALMNVAAQLYTSSYHRSGKLRWDREGNGYGFLLPSRCATFSSAMIGLLMGERPSTTCFRPLPFLAAFR